MPIVQFLALLLSFQPLATIDLAVVVATIKLTWRSSDRACCGPQNIKILQKNQKIASRELNNAKVRGEYISRSRYISTIRLLRSAAKMTDIASALFLIEKWCLRKYMQNCKLGNLSREFCFCMYKFS
eukprot:GHVP01001710.1.p1 GENE.GHVP01001710.1~~GHVP01001710.1.p1  ORF type:complete len:127 (+),score=6.13 GHVP01001710.1:131-511(+)